MVNKKQKVKPQEVETETDSERVFAKFSDETEIPLVSIFVLCYKNRALLEGMLDSIFEQDYPRIQLIVSDDGSGDFSVEDVQAYINEEKDVNIERVIVRQNKVNQGTVKHVSDILPLALGEYTVLTAADDRYNDSGAITACVRQFLNNPDSQWLVARCNLVTPDYRLTRGQLPTEIDVPFFEANDPQKLFSRWSRRGMAIPCCMMFRTTAFSVVGGIDLEYRYLEDWPLVLKLLRANHGPLFLNRVISVHSMGGVTNTNQSYGVEVRKAFYADKYHLMEKEVEPYRQLLTKTDQNCLKLYQYEIMARNYFLDIDCELFTRKEKLLTALKEPHKLIWLVERKYGFLEKKISHIKWLAGTQIFLLSGAFLLACGAVASSERELLSGLGWIELLGTAASLIGCVFSLLLKVYCHFKANKRRKLVM